MNDFITIDDYYKFTFLKSVDISPDGTKIAYVATSYKNKIDEKTKNEDWEEQTHIWLYDIETKETRQLTFGDADNFPSWSPNSGELIFSSKRKDKSQLYLLPMGGGEAKQLTQLEQGVSSKASWSPDARQICFSTNKVPPKAELPYRFVRDFYRLDAAGNVDNFANDLFILDINSGESTQITSEDTHNVSPNWSSSGKNILYLSHFNKFEIDGFYPQFKIINAETKEIVKPLQDYFVLALQWYGEAKVVFTGGLRSAKIGSNSHLYAYDISSGQIENRTPTFNLSFSGGLQADMQTVDGRLAKIFIRNGFAYTIIQSGGNMQIYEIALTGEEHIVQILPEDNSQFIEAIVGEKIFFNESSHTNPLDIVEFDLIRKTKHQLTSLNEEFLSTKQMPDITRILVQGQDGVDVEGWFFKPETSNGPLPTLLNIHGGPHYGWGTAFIFENHYLVGQGYAVLLINHRGSTGYGEEFSTKILGDWGNHDFGDLMAGVDYVVNQGWTDKDKLGCFGISGGGNLSCWIVGNTNRFKAAIPENPVTNWQSFYGVSDIGRWFAKEEMGGLPHEIPEVYMKCSPISYAHKCTTPTLLIQHDNDLRCPAEQSEQFFAVLRDVDCTVEMLRMPGTSHGGSGIGPPIIRETQNIAILAWFDEHILGKTT